MNYYPNNYYQNYPYGNNYPQYSQSTLPQAPQQPQYSLPQSTSLQGKVVDGEDIVRATEVPFGGYGVFPKADLSEIYIKSWNNDGTTRVITYKPTILNEEKQVDTTTILLDKINNIESKLDAITERYSASGQKITKEFKKEGTSNAF